MVDFRHQNRIQGFPVHELEHLPPSALTPEFLEGLREGYDLAEDRIWMRAGGAAIVTFVFGLLLGSMLP